MSEYTPLALPDMRDVRWWWVEGRAQGVDPAHAGDQFDRWLAAHDREVAAKALEDAARAAHIREGDTK